VKALAAIVLLALALAWAGSQGGMVAVGVPVFALCALAAFALQWLAYVPAYLAQTERFYDLVGSFTYLLLVGLALALTAAADERSLLLASLVALWAVRLGTFLFLRIRRDGRDSRFDRIKPSAWRFFLAWNTQGLWVLYTSACALAAITGNTPAPLGPSDVLGFMLWLFGFGIEVVADAQKRAFRARFGSGRFIDVGLWARSRHPNYFGEILLWIGVALFALPALGGWRLVTLISPMFVFLLLTRVSGVPLLERKAEDRWGSDAAYRAYRDSTPVLIPRL
jgi:steroid 5-alpha reductase family enzyme